MPTNDLTYTVTGTFDDSSIGLEAHLPALDGDAYVFYEIHDISKKIVGGTLNALLVFMKTDKGDMRALSWNGTDPDVALPVITPSSAITVHQSSPGFDWDGDEALIILYHEPTVQIDIDDMQKEIEGIYTTVKDLGAFSTTWSAGQFESLENAGSGVFVPKKAGMTIIAKL